MAGLIKKQILKHLSKFAKNLSADSINLSTLRGEGELTNLELDCVALQNLMNLPTWLQLNHAKCNRVHVKIPFTKLKTSPITILLDAVEVDMASCEKPREPNGASPIQASASSGDSSYGFVQKVLEGIAVRINSISVNFKSAVFKAEVQISQLLLFSTDPEGKQSDLRFTRILNKEWGQILTFKKVTWQTMRIVTDAVTSQSGTTATPIRLITNQVQVGITLRRKVSDLSLLATKLHIQFDDLLWVLTDAQVQSALLCVKSIRETIERSQQQEKLETSENTNNPATANTRPQAAATVEPNTLPASTNAYFDRYMVQETSFHLDLDRIDLHICDDGTTNNNQASYKKVVEGGAILMTFYGLKMDHYPAHKGAQCRSHFRDYGEIATARDKWADSIILNFRKDFVTLKKAAQAAGYSGSKSNSKLLESCLVFRLTDIEITQVTSSNDKERCDAKIVSSQRKELLLPDDMPLAFISITDYYYPDGRDYPAPHSNIFIRVNAPRLRLHWPSLLWCNQLALSTIRSVHKMLADLGIEVTSSDPKDEDHSDVRIETLMPKIFIPSYKTTEDPNSPLGLEIQVSQAAITNCRHGENCSRSDLAQLLQSIKDSFIYKNSASFPCEPGYDLDCIHHVLESHAMHRDLPINVALQANSPKLTGSTLKQKAYTDVWMVWLRQVWVDFVIQTDQSKASTQPSTLPFVDSLPITLWIAKTEEYFSDTSSVVSSISDGELKHSQSTLTLESIPLYTKPHPVSSPTSPLHGSSVKLKENLNRNDKDRPQRNKRLLDFYRSSLSESPTKSKVEELKPLHGAAGTYVMLHSDKPVRLMLDHYQFIFLMRLAESFEGIGKQVSSDTVSILSDQSSLCGDGSSSNLSHEDETSETTAVRLILPSAEISLVLRAAPEEPTPKDQEDPTSTMSSPDDETLPAKNPVDGFSSIYDGNQSSDTGSQDTPSTVEPPINFPNPPTTLPQSPVTSPRSATPAPSECSSDTVSILGGEDTFNPSIRTTTTCPVDIASTPLGGGNDQAAIPSPQTARKRANTTTDLSVAVRLRAESRLKSRLNVVSSPSSISSAASYENISIRSAVVSSSGYESGSMDSVQNPPVQTGFDDDLTSLDSSCDGDQQFVFIDVEGNPLNERTPLLVEEPAEGVPKTESTVPPLMMESQDTMVDNRSDISQDTVPFCEKPEPVVNMVSVLKIVASGGVELNVDSGGDNTALRIAAHALRLQELGNMSLQNAASKFASPDTKPSPPTSRPILPCLRMRLDSGPAASRFSEAAVSAGMLRINAQDFKETVLSSTLENIGAFLEDDVVPDVIPMQIIAHNVQLTIQDDKDPIYPTSARAPPVDLHVHNAKVTRDDDGVFHISTESSATTPTGLIGNLTTLNHASHATPTNQTPTQTNSQNEDHPSSIQNVSILSNGTEAAELHIETSSPLSLKRISERKLECRNNEPPMMNGHTDADDSELQNKIEELTRKRDELAVALQIIEKELLSSKRDRTILQNKIQQNSA